MKIFRNTLIILLLGSLFVLAEDKKVLVEIFTNSHCPVCVTAHATLDNYLETENGDKIEFIYYHMSFPYSTDAIHQHNTTDAVAKNNFYGPVSNTPKAFFSGQLVSNSWSNWQSTLDNLVAEESDFSIELSGNYTENDFTIVADITLANNVSHSDLTINYIVVEDVFYQGNNGISNHKNAMRKIVNPEGESFSISFDETKTLSTTIIANSVWDTENLKVVVYVQNSATKEVLQSATVPYSDLTITDVEDSEIISNQFKLDQNYPNPFNPTTKISYTVPNSELVQEQIVELNVFDILGKKVATLVKSNQTAGNYEVNFDADNLAGGFYFYQLTVGNLKETRKMVLLK